GLARNGQMPLLRDRRKRQSFICDLTSIWAFIFNLMKDKMAKTSNIIGKLLFRLPVKGSVFWSSSIILLVGIVLTLVYQQSAENTFSAIQDTVASNSGWLYILSVNVFLIFCLYLSFSEYGKIRIGGKDAKPEFNTGSWFAML